ncbi:MAG: hypothetical protein ABFD96_11075 [Armatimonadia bacterium]
MAGSGSRKRLQWLIASLVVVVGGLVTLQLLFPLRLYSMPSGAMEPTIRIGGTVVAAAGLRVAGPPGRQQGVQPGTSNDDTERG